jgi:hypothetical protein
MRDIVVLAIIAVFFALCVAYVRWCDNIIGPDPDGLRDEDVDAVDIDAEAGVRSVVPAPQRVGGEAVRR